MRISRIGSSTRSWCGETYDSSPGPDRGAGGATSMTWPPHRKPVGRPCRVSGFVSGVGLTTDPEGPVRSSRTLVASTPASREVRAIGPVRPVLREELDRPNVQCALATSPLAEPVAHPGQLLGERIVHADLELHISRPWTGACTGERSHQTLGKGAGAAAAGGVHAGAVNCHCPAAPLRAVRARHGGGTVSSAPPRPAALDALVAAPEHHRRLLEHARVRVADTQIRPGERAPVHAHGWPAVHHVVSSGEPLAPHSLENVGAVLIHIVSVELTPPGDRPLGHDL